jgi:uncharacterized protein YcnI
VRLLARLLTVSLLCAIVVLGAVPAFAHVTVRADDTSPGGFAKYTVRVPNESDGAATTSIEIQLPEGYEEARYQPLQGWDISVADGVLTIEGGRIEPGEFQEFSFSARNPEEPGDVIFPAIQTYDDGEVARWVGGPDADQPAPVVAIAAEGVEADDTGDDAATEEATPTDDAVTEAPTETTPTEAASEPTTDGAAPDDAEGDDSGTATLLAIIALIAAVLGLALGGAAFARTRRGSAA